MADQLTQKAVDENRCDWCDALKRPDGYCPECDTEEMAKAAAFYTKLLLTVIVITICTFAGFLWASLITH